MFINIFCRTIVTFKGNIPHKSSFKGIRSWLGQDENWRHEWCTWPLWVRGRCYGRKCHSWKWRDRVQWENILGYSPRYCIHHEDTPLNFLTSLDLTIKSRRPYLFEFISWIVLITPPPFIPAKWRAWIPTGFFRIRRPTSRPFWSIPSVPRSPPGDIGPFTGISPGKTLSFYGLVVWCLEFICP